MHRRSLSEGWVAKVEDCSVPELGAFMGKLCQEFAAVLTVLAMPYCQKQTEDKGQQAALNNR